jgi:hypothetical protein
VDLRAEVRRLPLTRCHPEWALIVLALIRAAKLRVNRSTVYDAQSWVQGGEAGVACDNQEYIEPSMETEKQLEEMLPF